MTAGRFYSSRMNAFGRGTLLTAALLSVTSCTIPTPEPSTSHLGHLEERLTDLAGKSEAFSSLSVWPDRAAAFVLQDEDVMRWTLTPELKSLEASRLPYPAVSFSDMPPSRIAAEAEALTAECGDEYEIEITAITPSALLGEGKCGDGTSIVRLNGAPLPEFKNPLSADGWQEVLDLIEELNGSAVVERISIGAGETVLLMGGSAMTNGCRPSLAWKTDGGEATWSCLQRLQPPGTLEDWTGSSLAAAVEQVAEENGISRGHGLEVSITPSQRDLNITVSNGAANGNAVMQP